MTIWQTLRSAVSGRSKYAQHRLKWGGATSLESGVSRQQTRFHARAQALVMVNQKNPGMSRQERRRLARAYAVSITRKTMAAYAKPEVKTA